MTSKPEMKTKCACYGPHLDDRYRDPKRVIFHPDPARDQSWICRTGRSSLRSRGSYVVPGASATKRWPHATRRWPRSLLCDETSPTGNSRSNNASSNCAKHRSRRRTRCSLRSWMSACVGCGQGCKRSCTAKAALPPSSGRRACRAPPSARGATSCSPVLTPTTWFTSAVAEEAGRGWSRPRRS